MKMPGPQSIFEGLFGPLDPAPVYRFWIAESDDLWGGFTQCSGFAARRDVLEIREGGLNTYTHKLPGRISYGSITLQRGVMFSNALWDWFEEGSTAGKVKRMNLSILHYSAYMVIPARYYNIHDAYPVAWNASDLDVSSSTVAVESLELAFTYIETKGLTAMAAAAATAGG
jgi:phage tail-like protein